MTVWHVKWWLAKHLCSQFNRVFPEGKALIEMQNLIFCLIYTFFLQFQYLTIMSIEVHARTRGDLRPDPEFDSICAIFYSILNDVPPQKGDREVTGALVVDRILDLDPRPRIPCLDCQSHRSICLYWKKQSLQWTMHIKCSSIIISGLCKLYSSGCGPAISSLKMQPSFCPKLPNFWAIQ